MSRTIKKEYLLSLREVKNHWTFKFPESTNLFYDRPVLYYF